MGTVSDWVCLSTRCSDLSTGVCVEWAQCKARAARWLEETILLAEEMRRVLYFLRWRRQWWLDQAQLRSDARSDIREGLEAYSAKQAQILEDLTLKFADEWYGLLIGNGLNTDWPGDLKEVRKGSVLGRSDRSTMGEEDGDLDDDDFFEY